MGQVSRLTRKPSRKALAKQVRRLETRIARLERAQLDYVLGRVLRRPSVHPTRPEVEVDADGLYHLKGVSDAPHLYGCAKVKAMLLGAPDIAEVCECDCGSQGDQEKSG